MLKKTVSVIVGVLLMLCSASVICCAEGSSAAIIQPFYSHVKRVESTLTINGGVLTCSARGDSAFDNTKTTLTATLQKRITGETKWSKVCSWSSTQTGTGLAIISKTKSASSGYDYRLHAKCVIKNEAGVSQESVSQYSSIVNY